MSSHVTEILWSEPHVLVKEVQTLFGREGPPRALPRTPMDDAVRRASELVGPDLYRLERSKQTGVTSEYRSLFGEQFDEKVAALIFLAQEKLLTIEHSPQETTDHDAARRDLASYVEVLYRVAAVDALAVLFEFASSQPGSRYPQLWENVRSRCLYLMTLLAEHRRQVYAFLHEHPKAVDALVNLVEHARQQVAKPLSELLEDYYQRRAYGELPRGYEPAGYVALFRQYERQAHSAPPPADTAVSVGQERIRQTLIAGDFAAVAAWVAQGAPATVRSVFRHARMHVTTDQYVTMLEYILGQPLEPLRKTAAVLELGQLNRTVHPHGGMPRVNTLLRDVALSRKLDEVGVARVAVIELGSVSAYPVLHEVMFGASQPQVVAETIHILKDLRHLPANPGSLQQQPSLLEVFQAAQRELYAISQLVQAAATTTNEEQLLFFLERLRTLRAIPELRQLAMRSTPVAEHAQRLLAGLREDGPARFPWGDES